MMEAGENMENLESVSENAKSEELYKSEEFVSGKETMKAINEEKESEDEDDN